MKDIKIIVLIFCFVVAKGKSQSFHYDHKYDLYTFFPIFSVFVSSRSRHS